MFPSLKKQQTSTTPRNPLQKGKKLALIFLIKCEIIKVEFERLEDYYGGSLSSCRQIFAAQAHVHICDSRTLEAVQTV